MTLYAIGEKSPQLPDEENYWIAPGAHVGTSYYWK